MDRKQIKREKLHRASGSSRLWRQLVGQHGIRILGSIATPLGMVAVHSECGRNDSYTLYRFVLQGYEYRYVEEHFRNEYALASKAHQFAKEVVKMVEGAGS